MVAHSLACHAELVLERGHNFVHIVVAGSVGHGQPSPINSRFTLHLHLGQNLPSIDQWDGGICSRVPVSVSVTVLSGIDLLNVVRRVLEWSLFELEGSADHVLKSSWTYRFWWVLVSQLLHVFSVALADGMLIDASGSDDPFS